jgi:outer membrane protein assembly factor BamD (BamD/ComL family)
VKNLVRILILLQVISCLAGCAVFAKKPDPGQTSANLLFRQKKYAEALEGYRKLLSLPHDPERDASARYSIALILAYYDNPQKNYSQALEAFEEFLRLYPDHEKAAEALNWKNTLKALQEENRESDHLKKNIEQLKRLDIRHEEKRKGK